MKNRPRLLFAAAVLLAPAGPAAHAQTAAMMPDGSYDAWAGVLATLGPRSEGSQAQALLVLPNFSVRWSNGVFLDGLRAGVDLSDDPMLNFGPTLRLGRRAPRADAPDARAAWGLDPGLFLRYALAHNLGVDATIEAGQGHDGRGLLMRLGAYTSMALSGHQRVRFDAGLQLADAAYLRSDFGLPGYQPGGGLKSSYAGASWQVELGNKYRLVSGLYLSRLADPAARSPIVAARASVRLSTALSYHF